MVITKRNLLATIVVILIWGLFSVGSVDKWFVRYQDSQGYLFENQERDISYQLMINNWQDITEFVETNYPKSLVLGSFPENLYLTQPFQGYVSTQVEFMECTKLDVDRLKNKVIMIRHKYSPGQMACEKILLDQKHRILKHSARNGWWVDVYEVDFE